MGVYPVKITAIAVKMQTTYDVDPVPTLATDAVRFEGIPTLNVATLEDGKRGDAQHAGLGQIGRATPQGRTGSIDVTLALFGKGTQYTTVNDAFPHDPFLRGAGLAKSYATNKVTYTTLDVATEYFTLYLWGIDGRIYKLLNCVAKPKLSFVRGRFGLITYGCEGRISTDPVMATISGLALPAIVPPTWNDVVTSIGSWSTATAAPNQLLATKLEIDFGTQTKMRDWAGANTVLGPAVIDRMMRATMEVEAVAVTTWDPYGRALDNGVAPAVPTPIATQLNGGVGNTIDIVTGQWQLAQPKQLNLGGLAGWGLDGELVARSIAAGLGAGREFALSIS